MLYVYNYICYVYIICYMYIHELQVAVQANEIQTLRCLVDELSIKNQNIVDCMTSNPSAEVVEFFATMATEAADVAISDMEVLAILYIHGHYTHIHTYLYIHMHIYTDTHICTNTQIHTDTYKYLYSYTHSNTNKHK